jgi:hypothetical protein
MATTTFDYALGYTNSEHDRLIRQAARIAPYTERLFREIGYRCGPACPRSRLRRG